MCSSSPGFLFCFVAGLLLCGIDRKLVAKMQKRVGPPILQPFYDFFKLCGKETIIPGGSQQDRVPGGSPGGSGSAGGYPTVYPHLLLYRILRYG